MFVTLPVFARGFDPLVEFGNEVNKFCLLEFLKTTLKQYPQGRIVMILDNARIHHAKLVQPFLDKIKDRITLMYLPPYSPELNLIGELWGWLKSSVINNVIK